MKKIKELIKKVFIKICYLINPIKSIRMKGVKVGEGCSFMGCPNFGSEPYLIEIGNHVLCSFDVCFITHEGGHWVFRDKQKYKGKHLFKYGRIVIKDNCFIGAKTIIMPGVTIGKNCIIGSGSVVTKDIPDNSVAAGVPCKIITDVDSFEEKFVASMPEFDVDNYLKHKKDEVMKITLK